jgi:hypothetical protein
MLMATLLSGCGSNSEPDATTPSAASASTSPTVDPAAQEAHAGALAAYNNFREAQLAAFAESDVSGGELPKYVADPLLGELQVELQQNRTQGLIMKGRPKWSPRVVAVSVSARPFTVQMQDCFDTTAWDIVDEDTGRSVAVPGQAKRYLVSVEAALYDDGRWLIRQATAQRERPC